LSPKSIAVDAETARKWRKMIAMGHTRADIARMYGKSRQYVTSVVGPIDHSVKRDDRTVYIDPDAWERVKSIAAGFGFRIRTGENAGHGSIAMMLENIANGNLIVNKVEDEVGTA
jgi:hypothetical protein